MSKTWEASGGGDNDDIRFTLTPVRVDPDVRNEYYEEQFETFATSVTAMENISVSETVMDEVSTSTTAMDAVSTSSTAMDAVSTSSTAMDAVSVSDLALDAIWDSQDVGWAAVRDRAMAVGKFAAGRAGLDGSDYADIDAVATDQTAMDAVSTSSTAMDAVSASTTAMDAVMTSLLARSTLLQSQFAADSVWQDTNGSQRVWDEGETFDVVSDEIDFHFVDEFPDSEIDFQIDFDGSTTQDREEGFQIELDFDRIDELNIDTKFVGDERSGANFLAIKADQDVLFETDSNHSQTTRNLDTTDITGTKDLRLIYEQKDSVSDTFDMFFGIITG